jgi:hypothetical protein
MNPEDLYRRLGRLIESVPKIAGIAPLTTQQMTWLGQAEALVDIAGDIGAKVEFATAKSGLGTPPSRQAAMQALMIVLYKLLASAELASPASAQGAFIPVGNGFDSYAAIAKIMSSATTDVFIVDPYMDDTVLLDFGGALPEKVLLRLLTDEATVKPSLSPAATRWANQYQSRPVQVRLAAPRTLHDRAIFIDHSEAWTVTQSLKDLAKRSPAEIVRAADIAALKIAAYDQIWMTAKVLV